MKLLLSFFFLCSLNLLLEPTPNYTKDELLGTFDPKNHPDFKPVSPKLTQKTNIYLRIEVLQQFDQMFQSARRDGIELEIVSATRNYNYQKGIWERKWKRSKYMGWQNMDKVLDIMKYSSMPGTSRHHWGTDVDLNQLNNEYFESGQGQEVYQWLVECAPDYGFHQVYTNKDQGRTGYQEEKWHWSYLPLSEEMLKQYNEKIRSSDLPSFSGVEHIDSLKIFQRYVNGIELN